MDRRKNRGIAFVIVISCLMAMSIIAVGFVRLSIIEQAAAQNHSLLFISKLNAQSGIHQAIAMLREIPHFTEFAPAENDHDWLFKNNDASELGVGLDLLNARADAAINERCTPSFALRNPDTSLITVGNFYISGTIRATHFNYALKIIDTSSQLHLNHSKFRLIHMLTTLFEEVFAATLPSNASSWQEMAERILQHRETLSGQIFADKRQISGGNLLTVSEYDQIKDFVTIHGWQNPHTWAAPDSSFYDPTKPNYVVASKRNTCGFVSEPRAPVNINTASKPVLVAVLSGLKGFRRIFDDSGTDPYRKLRVTKVAESFSAALARQIANAIISHRQNFPFKLWNADCSVDLQSHSFNKFIDDLSIVGLTDEKKDLIKTNVNPNALINRWMPNKERYFPADKSDITPPDASDPINGATTEFCFTATGTFEIESIGRVFHPVSSVVLSESHDKIIARIFHPVMHTTQRDFFSGPLQTDVITFPETIYHCGSSNLVDQAGNNVVQSGSTLDGYIQLKNTREFTTSRQAFLFFQANNFGDLWEARVGSSDISASIQEKVPVFASNSSNTLKARSIFKGEFRTPEGCLSHNYGSTTSELAPTNGQMLAFTTSSLNLNSKNGTVAMWIKFENIHSGADEAVLHISHKIDLGIRGFETSVFRYVNQATNRNELHIVRWAWQFPPNILSIFRLSNLSSPQNLWTRIIIPNIDNLRQSRKWYRLVISWEDYTKVHAVFTHDGTNNNATSLFHYSESLPNTIPNIGPLTLHLDRGLMSDLNKNGSPFGNSSILTIGGYAYTPILTLSLFSQSDMIITIGVPTYRFANATIARVESYNVCHLISDGSDFYETPYPTAALANPGGVFEQNITLDCGCGTGCSSALQISQAEYTIWNPGDSSGVEVDSQTISPTDAELTSSITGNCGNSVTYRVSLTSDDGETSPIFDDITVFCHLAYPQILYSYSE